MKLLMYITITALISINTAYAGDIIGTVKATGTKDAGNAVIFIEKVEGKTFSATGRTCRDESEKHDFYTACSPGISGNNSGFSK